MRIAKGAVETRSVEQTGDDVSQLEAATPAFNKDSGEGVKKKRPRKSPEQDRIRTQRIDFATARLDENGNPHASWQTIYEEYAKKYPKDKDASADTIRLSVQRNPTKSDTSDS